MMDRTKYLYLAGTVVLAAAPAVLNTYWVDVLNNVGMYAILGLSLNLIVGHAGLFNLGHAAFYAIGAYTAAILNSHFHIPVLWLLPLSALTAGLFALMIARPIIHLRGDYLCIVTIGVGEIVRIALINNVFGITGGANGIFGIDRPQIFGWVIRRPQEFYYLIWLFLMVTVFLLQRLENSRFGRALNYLREDETAAEGSGIHTAHYKLMAFVIGAAWAGMVGNIFAICLLKEFANGADNVQVNAGEKLENGLFDLHYLVGHIGHDVCCELIESLVKERRFIERRFAIPMPEQTIHNSWMSNSIRIHNGRTQKVRGWSCLDHWKSPQHRLDQLLNCSTLAAGMHT